MQGYDDKNNNIENNEQGLDTNVLNEKKEEYIDIFSNEPDKRQINQNVEDNISNPDIDDDYFMNNTSAVDEKNNYQYYQFSNTSNNKSFNEIREEEKAERLRQKLLKKQHYATNSVNNNGGFTVKKFFAMTGLAIFLGVMAGLSFFATARIAGNAVKSASKQAENAENYETVTVEDKDQRKIVEATGYKVLNDVSQIVAMNKPAMVNISATTKTQLQDFFRGSYYKDIPVSGSGFIISEDEDNYYIATNNHVVDNGSNLSVAFIDNTVAPATIKGKDSHNDLAVISVKKSDITEETKQKIKKVEIGDSNNLVEGQAVIAMGNALGYGQSTTNGIISAIGRSIQLSDGSKMEDLIQTDAAINFGNSGGALIDATGRVIGINSAKNGSEAVEGMGYAIPISKAEPIINKILQDDRKIVDIKNRGMLGVTGFVTDENIKEAYGIPVGFYIKNVTKGLGADKAGILNGDVIVEVNGFKVKTQQDIAERLQYFEVGETVDVGIMRNSGGEYKFDTKKVVISAKDKNMLNQEEEQRELEEYKQNRPYVQENNEDRNDFENDGRYDNFNYDDDSKIGELFEGIFGVR